MGDAEDAQYSAFADVFARDSSYTYLMCFFHVLQNVQKKIPFDCRSEVLQVIYDMHFSNSEVEFLRHRDKALMRWRDDPRTQAFSGYFEKQWLNDRYSNRQVYHTLSGYATTNNPVEQYNKVIKRDYTLHTRIKLGMLLRLLRDCCTDESMNQRPFQKTVKATDRLARRARRMVQYNLLFEGNVRTTAPSLLAELQRGAIVNVFSAQNFVGE
ncbi:hypothetical protein PF008_g19807 [Phytophthora fragariae]|uniref:MULE transposase domain-containing protein n=1 Tax=Phytophthora fragariae TaxID=53985 RepID=A0A6G0R1B6_9STRA|nr:hypothetical protein PF008_g19807 [Phytophthora fragariae]